VGAVQRSRGIEFQMAGAAQRKEREPKFVVEAKEERYCRLDDRRVRVGWKECSRVER
jgi:hypothetical protein